nr:hypothetical protein [Lachnospiraceae bacterium]
VVMAVLAMVFVLGAIVNTICIKGKKNLKKAIMNLENTNDIYLKKMKKNFSDKCKNMENVYNVDSFVDKCVYNYEFLGIKLFTLKKICGQVRVIVWMVSMLFVAIAYFYDSGKSNLLLTITCSILCTGFMELLFKNVDNVDEGKMLKAYATDYLENNIKAKYIISNKNDINIKPISINEKEEKNEKDEVTEDKLTPKEKIIRISRIDCDEKRKNKEKILESCKNNLIEEILSEIL